MSVPAPRWGLRNQHRALFLLALAVLLKGAVWALTLPAFDPPDEVNHYSHAQLIAVSGRLPAVGGGAAFSPDVTALYNAVLTPVQPGSARIRLLPERMGPGLVGPHEAAARRAPVVPVSATSSAQYGPVTYSLFAAAIWLSAGGGIVAQLMAARLVSAMLGMGAALATVWAAREARVAWPLALCAGVIVGYQPMFSQQTAAVTTDAGTFLFGAAALAVALRYLRQPSPGLAAALGAVIFAALMSKPAMVFLIPLLLVTVVPAFGPVTRRDRARTVLLSAAVGLLTIVPFAVWNQLHASALGPGANRGSVRSYLRILTSGGFEYPLGQVDSFWGNFGALEQTLPGPLLLVGRILLGAGVAAIVWAVVTRRRPRPTAALLCIALVLGCTAVAVGFDLVLWRNQRVLGLQGRYFLPALPSLAVAIVWAVQKLAPRRYPGVAVAIAVTMVSINIAALFTLWDRYFVS